MKATPERIHRNVHASLAALAELELHASALATRGDELAKYLTGADIEAAQNEIDSHRYAAKQATDEVARSDYQQAASAAQERHKALLDISAALERTHANLAKIVATMRGIPSKLVRLRTLDDRASDALTGDVGEELERMNLDLRSFEQTLEGIV
jgi:predicted  nucleic acid-binding Zn-ribbon protein